MQGMMIESYGGSDVPHFTIYGVRVPEAPTESFEAKVTLQITRQSTPVDGESSVEVAVLDIEADGVEFEKVEATKTDSADSLGKEMEAMMAEKASSTEDEED